jgi:putative two-component system response regulator
LESVAELSATLAAMLGMKPESISQVRLASRLHDIGKLVWQDRILTSREMLASHDRVEVQAHADAGANLLAAFANSPTLRLAAEMARSHHERLDGTGYPRGLKADQISTEVRIVSVASAFVAMRSPRPYREPLGISVALTHIQGLKDAAYDAEVVQALQNTMTAPVSGETRT